MHLEGRSIGPLCPKFLDAICKSFYSLVFYIDGIEVQDNLVKQSVTMQGQFRIPVEWRRVI